MRTSHLQSYLLGIVFTLVACSGTDTNSVPTVGTSGGANPAGGSGTTNSGGSAGITTTGRTGGASAAGGTSTGSVTGGAPQGGTATGGKSAAGTAIGGGVTGGTATGGAATGGNRATGAAATGGASTGGSKATGGAATGGAATGGSKATGGVPTGGVATGGNKATGGAATGGAATGGNKPTGGASTGGSSSTISCSGPALSGGTQHCSSNLTGTSGSYGWQIWSSGTGGCFTPYGVGAAFKATWNNSGDFLAREGCQWNATKTFDQYGDITADYAYTKSGTFGTFSFIGVYGWSNNPLIEYYIVDDWFGGGAPPTGNGTLMGSLSVDGGTYNIYKHQQVNQPSYLGTLDTFWQYFSVRQVPRQCGHIDVTAHFQKWASLGLNLGVLFEAKLLIEVGGGSGSIDYSSAAMTCN